MSLVLLLAAAAALGRLAGRVLPMGTGAEGWVFRFAAGLSGCSVLVLAVGAHSLLSAQVALFVVVVLGMMGEAAGWVYAHPMRRGLPRGAPAEKPEQPPAARPGLVDWTCLAVVVLSLGMAFFAAWAPASDPAATGGTLLLAKGHAQAGSMKPLPNLAGSGGPPLMNALYTAVFFGSGERAALMLAWFSGLLACAAAYSLGRRIAGPRAGAVAAALFACMPVFFDQTSTASTGLAQALFVMAAFAALLAWMDEGNVGRLALAGWMAGSAVGVGFACVPAVLLLPAVALFSSGPGLDSAKRGTRLHGALLLAGATALCALPFLLRTALVTGDPIHPWFQSLFPLKDPTHTYVSTLAADPAFARDGFSPAGFLRYPWDVIMRPLRFDGWAKSPGGLVIALIVPALLYGGRRVWMATLPAAAGVMALWFTHRGALPALPCFALTAAACGAALPRMPRWRGAMATALLTGCLFGLGLHALRLRDQIPVLTGQETRQAYLARRAPGYGAWEAVNRRAARVPGVRVLVLDDSAYFAEAPVFANHDALRVQALKQGGQQLAWLKQQNVGLIMLPQTLLEDDSPLAPEVRAMAGFWKSNTAVFPPAERVDLLRVGADGVERVDILAFAPIP